MFSTEVALIETDCRVEIHFTFTVAIAKLLKHANENCYDQGP